MKSFFRRLFHPFVIGTLAVLMLCAIVWWLAPLIAIGESHPFDGVALRAAIVAALCIVWAINIAVIVWRRKRTNARLLQGMAAGPSASDREAQVLNQRFTEALGKLRSSSKRSWLQPGAYLYELPWYVFIGAPGSGKTTALMNAGLQFLLTDTAAQGAVRGVGGTRNCDWWFTRDAVMIDTAGRYTTQESDQSVDASAWGNFLALLKKTRPRQPINGVLLTVNVQDLLQQGPHERADHAARLRARLAELEERLGVRAPVYVLVTKADLIGGFFETFGELAKEDRDQVWGFTSELAPAGSSADPLAEFDQGYAGLEWRLGEMLNDRLAGERDPSKRAAQFGFVQEFAALRTPLRDFLSQVFSGGSASQAAPLVRGVYFTSGTQEGTPIDRVMGALSRSFGLTRRAASAQLSGKGRSFFLNALLHKVVFEERGLVSTNAAAERRRAAWRWSVIGLTGIVGLAVLIGWLVSYSRNTGYANEVVSRIPPLRQTVASLPPGQAGDVAPLSVPLSAVRDAAAVPAFPIDRPPLLNTLGLYQGDKLDAAAKLSYHRLLEHAMLPRITRRLEERLRAANKDNLEAAYLALKSYLMLYTPDQFDADTLKAWIGVDWDAQYASLAPEQRKELDAHLDALLADGAPQATVPMDKALVASVRDMLAAFPLDYRIYSRLKRQAVGNDIADFSVARAAGPNAAQVFTRASGEPLTRGVPGLYTREGYQRLFQQVPLQKAAVQLATEESWVLGMKSDPARLKDIALNSTLTNSVRRLYLNEYVQVWDNFLADVRIVKLDSLSRSVEVARLLGGTDSPLSAFMREVANQTTLTPAPAAAPAAVTALADKAKAAREEANRLAGGQPTATAAAGADQPIERIVDDHFVIVRRLFQGQPPPIEEQQKLFNEAYTQLAAVDAAQKSKSPPPAGGGGDKLKAAAAQQPPLVRAMMDSLVDVGAKQGRAAERDVLTAELKPITDFCVRAISNRYPFAASSGADVLPEDFGQLFGNGGMLDDFYQRRLASLVDTGKATWVYKPTADGSAPGPTAALAEFQRASRIKEAFFRSGGKAPGFKLDIRAELADGLKELTLDIDGQPAKFVAGSNAVVTISWPSTRVASDIRVSTVPATSPINFSGPWALFRMFDRFDVQPSDRPEKFSVALNLDGKRARLDVTANSVLNPFRLPQVRQFRCPGAL